MSTIPAIPTRYDHTNFRSRLEARWAAFFDLLHWHWTYEPVDAEGYIPDFLIHGPRPLFIEVGPCITEADYREKAVKPNASRLAHDILVVGVSPLAAGRGMGDFNDGHPKAGWLGESTAEGWLTEPPLSFDWGWGQWFQCLQCRQVNIMHEVHSYQGRPCGHHEGDGHLGLVDPGELDYLWQEAGNDVKWRRG